MYFFLLILYNMSVFRLIQFLFDLPLTDQLVEESFQYYSIFIL